LLCLLMARNQIITEAVGFGSSRSPLGNPAHILLLDLNPTCAIEGSKG